MRKLLLWLVMVAVMIAAILGGTAAFLYSRTGTDALPQEAVTFGEQTLEPNGWSWVIPVLGDKVNKTYESPTNLTVQKLGVLYTAHPELTVPDWTGYTALTIQNAAGDVLFAGSAGEYQNFLFPANGEYKAELTAWRVPKGGVITQFEGGSTGQLRKNLGLERPAKPTGWYRYSFRFTLQASAEVELSAERVEQGGTVGVRISGMTGDAVPTIETDLGSVQCVRAAEGWRAYIPAAYNASSGGHEVNITVNGETITRTLTVLPKDFGTVEVEAEEPAPESANAQFRSAIWPLYEAAVTAKQWQGGFVPPAEDSMTLVDYGQIKVTNGQQGSRSNSTKLYTIPGAPCRAAANGTVVFAGSLELTGNTVVIDHGCGLRSYLYGLQEISVSRGQTVEKGQLVGYVGATGAATGPHCHFEMYYNNALISARNVFPDM